MNFYDIVKSSELLSSLPYIHVISVLIELEKMKLLKEEIENDTCGNIG